MAEDRIDEHIEELNPGEPTVPRPAAGVILMRRGGRHSSSGLEVLLTDNAKPGQTIQIAVLAINGPFGNPPTNFIFFRSPTDIRFFKK